MTQKRNWLVAATLACTMSPLALLAESSTTDESPVEFEGVLMLDASRFDGVYGDGEERTETDVRRATVGISAELAPNLELELSAKLEEGLDEAETKDALLDWEFAKRQHLIIGRQKEPVGLENNQSSKQIPAIERSMASALFTPDRHTGIKYSNSYPKHSFAVGVFEADSDSDDSGLATSARVTTALLKTDAQTVHLGASGTYRDLGGMSLKLKDEGGVNLAENIVSGKRRDVDELYTVALEAVWLRGPLTVQAEWFQTDLTLAESEDAEDPAYTGSYIQGSWLFGNARRKYGNGKFKLSGLKGSSAWEVVLRAGWADLTDDEDGTKAETLMAGVNYYWGKHLRVMGSVMTAETSGPDVSDEPDGDAATVRLQYVF